MNGAPERLGRYELLARLATGGMGEVFLARLEGAEGFEKLYAVKRVQDAGTVDFGINAPEDDELISAAAPKLRLCNARFPGKDTEIVVVLDVAPDGTINPPVRYEPESYQGTLLGDCLQKALLGVTLTPLGVNRVHSTAFQLKKEDPPAPGENK